MRYVNKFDFIVENVAQARAILNRNNITYDNPIYQEILRTTKRDGYTGFITKIVFELGVDKDDAIEIYYKVKDGESDVSKLNQLSKEEVEKLLVHEENGDYIHIFTENHYKVFRVDTYEGILKISSPAWCLKTKSHWDSYTITKKGKQFVVIHERFVPRDNSTILLTTPSDWDGRRYESGSYDKMRFGVTVYPSGRMDIFDDRNVQLTFRHGELSNNDYHFIIPILNRILEYYNKHFPKTTMDWEEYDDMKDTITEIMHSLDLHTCFSYLAPYNSVDEKMNGFYEKIRQEFGLNKMDFLKSMNKFRDEILSDDDFISHDGYMDILVNEFLTANGEESLPNVPNVTTRSHPLGGYYFDEQESGDLVIKYGYGYQYTKYGKAAIEQGFGSVKAFYKKITDNFPEILLEQTYVCFDLFYGEIDEEHLAHCMKNEEYKDGYRIIIDIPKLFRLIGNEVYEDTKELAEKFKEELSSRSIMAEIDSDENDIEVPSVSIFICTK